MSSDQVNLSNLTISSSLINYQNKAISSVIEKVYGKSIVLPVNSETLTMELKGVSTVVPHAIQRVGMDEIDGYCLKVNEQTYHTTDPFMVEHFTGNRIQQIPLILGLTDEEIDGVVFSLHIENPHYSVSPVYSGHLKLVSGNLKRPIFNPTFELAMLQPGRCLNIEEIKIERGVGRDHAAFAVGIRGYTKPLDVKMDPNDKLTKYSDESLRNGDADRSGYLAKSLNSDPKHHLVGIVFPAVLSSQPKGQQSKIALKLVCANIITRLEFVKQLLEAKDDHNENLLIISTEAGTKINIMIKNETHTIGNLIKRYAYEVYPDISYAGHTCVPHEEELKIYLVFSKPIEDARKITIDAINKCCKVFEKISSDI